MWTLDQIVDGLAGFFSPKNVALASGIVAGSIAATANAQPAAGSAGAATAASASTALPAGSLGQTRAGELVRNLNGKAPAPVVDALKNVYAGLQPAQLRKLGCTTFEVDQVVADASAGQVYVFVQPTDIGGTSGRNASLETNLAMLYRCDSLAGIIGRTGLPQNTDLEQWATTTIQTWMASNINKEYMGNETVAQPSDFSVVYEVRNGMRVVRGIRVTDAARRQALNTKATEKGAKKRIVLDNGHVLWLPNRAGQPEYGHNLAEFLLRSDSPSVSRYNEVRLAENDAGNLRIRYGGSDIFAMGAELQVPPGGAEYTINSSHNLDSVVNNGDTVTVYTLTPTGKGAGLTPSTFASIKRDDLAKLASEGKLQRTGTRLPKTADVENPSVKVTLQPDTLYVVAIRDNVPGGTGFSATAFETKQQRTLTDADYGTVLAQYDDGSSGTNHVDLSKPNACVPTDRDVTFLPSRLNTSLETRADVAGIGVVVDAANPFASPASDFSTPVRVATKTSLVQYLRQIANTTAIPSKTFSVVPCPPTPEPDTVPRQASTFLGVLPVLGDRMDDDYVRIGADFDTLTTERPTSGNVATVRTTTLHVRADGRIDVGADDGLAALLHGRYQHLNEDSGVEIDGRKVQDIRGQQLELGLGAEYRGTLGDGARVYAVPRLVVFGDGSTDTQLPPASDGAERSLLTERDVSGFGGEAGLALRLGRFAFEGRADYARSTTIEHAAFSGGSGESEKTRTTEGRLALDGYVGVDLWTSRFVPLAGAAYRRESQTTDANGAEQAFSNTRVDAGFQLNFSPLSNTLLVGYDQATGMVRVFDRLDFRHVSIFLETQVLGNGDSDVRRPVDIHDAPYVTGGVEVRR